MKHVKTKIEQAAEENLPENRSETPVVNLSSKTIFDIADAIAERLERFAVLHSRLCAADTVHTSERPDTVFRHAIKEAEIANVEIDKYLQAIND